MQIGKIQMKPLITEKAIMMIEMNNTLCFETEKQRTKGEIKKELEDLLDIKIEGIRTLVRNNKKYAYVKLKKQFPAIDVATKLGVI